MFLSSDSSLKHPLYPVQIEHHRWEAICQGAQSETITCRGCQAMGASRPLSILGSPLSRQLHIWNHGNAYADTCPPFPPSTRESCYVAQVSPSSVPSSIVVFDALQHLVGGNQDTNIMDVIYVAIRGINTKPPFLGAVDALDFLLNTDDHFLTGFQLSARLNPQWILQGEPRSVRGLWTKDFIIRIPQGLSGPSPPCLERYDHDSGGIDCDPGLFKLPWANNVLRRSNNNNRKLLGLRPNRIRPG